MKDKIFETKDLIKFKPKYVQLPGTYNIYFQFDDDDPKILMNNIPLDQSFKLQFNKPDEGTYVAFFDYVQNKTFKIFAK